MFHQSDNVLVSKALDGSGRSWEKLVRRHETRLYNYCLRMSGSEADALDLMQDIFLSVFRNLPSWNGSGAFSHWLMRIAANKVIDLHRMRQRQPLEPEELQNVYENTPTAENDTPVISHEHAERNRQVLVAMQSLPAEQRLLVELKFFQQLTFEEISMQTGIPVNTVKSRLYSSLGKLKDNPEVRYAL